MLHATFLYSNMMEMAANYTYSCATYEAIMSDHAELPMTDESVWVLGRQYNAAKDRDELKDDLVSRLWFTYRRGFSQIDGMGPASDSGWGCMLRCGQMMLAQALILRHIGRDWRWKKGQYDPKYIEILRHFLDKKACLFSIHQIACMGVTEGKPIGSWFGPNTVAQVIKKLVYYDRWSSLAYHIAMDNTVIVDDITTLCLNPEPSQKTELGPALTDKWRPLVLIIPLRLGLSEINPIYIDALKKCLSFPQSIGIIGGKPNHAYWFLGYIGDELIYLDPHVTQPTADVTAENETDESYHCPYVSRMFFLDMDPSLALGFYCGSQKEFDDLCANVKEHVTSQPAAIFEVHTHRPSHWPPFVPYKPTAQPFVNDFTIIDRKYDSDEEFEIL